MHAVERSLTSTSLTKCFSLDTHFPFHKISHILNLCIVSPLLIYDLPAGHSLCLKCHSYKEYFDMWTVIKKIEVFGSRAREMWCTEFDGTLNYFSLMIAEWEMLITRNYKKSSKCTQCTYDAIDLKCFTDHSYLSFIELPHKKKSGINKRVQSFSSLLG